VEAVSLANPLRTITFRVRISRGFPSAVVLRPSKNRHLDRSESSQRENREAERPAFSHPSKENHSAVHKAQANPLTLGSIDTWLY
jgi:hypothetical protein